MFRTRRNPRVIWPVLLSGLILAALQGAAVAATKLPEVSSDGLHLLKNTKVRIAYARPGASLKAYERVKLLDCFVQFKKGWQREYNLDEVGLSGRVSDREADEIKQRLAAEFKKVFTERLERRGHPVVEEAASDVLLLRPALLNVDVTAPDTRSAGRDQTYIRSAGSMTLLLELYDSSTGTLLARIIDPQADEQSVATEAGRAVNKQAADRILRRWADLLADHLTDVEQRASGD